MRRFALLLTLFAVIASPAAVATDASPDALRDALLAPPIGAPDSGVAAELPVGDGASSTFEMRDSRTVPPGLARRFPGLRSFRGVDPLGRTARLDLANDDLRLAVRDGANEWVARATKGGGWTAPASPNTADAKVVPPVLGAGEAGSRKEHASGANARAQGGVRYDFRLAVATDSGYATKAGGTVAQTLGEVVHLVNRANEVFETDMGVHFTLVEDSDRLIPIRARQDPFLRGDPVPTAVEWIDGIVGGANYDIGHALLDMSGGQSEVGTSCTDARDADFMATHKAAAWSGTKELATSPQGLDFFIHVLGRQLGAWPTAAGCQRDALGDHAVEPGSGSTAMGYASATCAPAATLQARADRYFHAVSIGQMHDWLSSRGGRCATKRLNGATAPWIDPRQLDEWIVVPARTPFALEALATPGERGRRLTYAWEQMGAYGGAGTDTDGILFRSWPPTTSGRRTFPRMADALRGQDGGTGERLPTATRTLDFTLTVRDNAGESSTLAQANARVHVVDTGQAFAVDVPATATAGEPMPLRWNVAGTDADPIACHFVDVDLSLDGGDDWTTIAVDEPNDGDAAPVLPDHIASDRARVRVRCDRRPFFAVTTSDFSVVKRAAR
ncbi:reprolysin-like metallopeptidase [Luteibacter sp. 3190]|uniref:reprolysin-like metallopeptidase n=1 Tax=Luteibacter sp. 3190 TaxID=2817736 RepID=UPI0028569F23|nr:zinc-dependent metalloprotease family protein [Luteibacter sp. 3190]MDR6938030.1 hypothetical protein [Luteibacter sp. 3190]